MKARYKIKENVTYQLKDKFGNIKKLFQENKLYRWLIKHNIRLPQIPLLFGYWSNTKLISNLTTTTGKAGMASRFNGDGGEAAFTYIAVGTGTTAADVANTTLETEITDSGLARASATASRVTTDTTNDTAQLTKTFAVTGTKAVTESGVLNAASDGTLAARQVFSAINVVSGDSLIITWKFDVD
jgi:hypothetical protein